MGKGRFKLIEGGRQELGQKALSAILRDDTVTFEDLMSKMQHPPSLTIMDGGHDENEKLFQRLVNEPQTFEQAEFERLMAYFKPRISFEEGLSIIEKQFRLGEDAETLEIRLLLSIINGNDDEHEHLKGILTRRNALGLKVIFSKT